LPDLEPDAGGAVLRPDHRHRLRRPVDFGPPGHGQHGQAPADLAGLHPRHGPVLRPRPDGRAAETQGRGTSPLDRSTFDAIYLPPQPWLGGAERPRATPGRGNMKLVKMALAAALMSTVAAVAQAQPPAPPGPPPVIPGLTNLGTQKPEASLPFT